MKHGADATVLLAELKALQDENAAVKTNLNRLEKILEAQKAEVSALVVYDESCLPSEQACSRYRTL